MSVHFDRPLYFKHLYGTTVNEWGVIAFPGNQPAGTAAGLYRRGSPVLLAIPQAPLIPKDRDDYPDGYEGKIFGVCTLLPLASSNTREFANPEWVERRPEDVAQWHSALPIHEMWTFENALSYESLGGGTLARLAQNYQGKLIPPYSSNP